ncbi:MAG: hypothetical protein IIW48_00730 [Clostridia bacterium]|nr:hypothetical protein [Clostridia bacterium]
MNGSNFSPEQLMRLLMNSKGGTQNSSIAQDIINNKLTPEQRQRIDSILRDKTALERLMNSPQAQEIMKKMGKKE